MNPLIQLFQKSRSIGVVGNPNSAKSSLVLSQLLDLKRQKPTIPIYILGAEKSLHTFLESNKINILYSTDDILDMNLKNSVIYIDEFADLFNVQMASKQTARIRRFFNRIVHLNNYVIISSAEVNFWNKFMCGLVDSYLVKNIDFLNLVRGTNIKRRIQNIAENTSEYRLDIPPDTYYIINNGQTVAKRKFDYVVELDPKKDNVNLFASCDPKLELSSGVSLEIKKEGVK